MFAPIRISIAFSERLRAVDSMLAIFVAAWMLYSIPIVLGLFWTRKRISPDAGGSLKAAASLAIVAPPVLAAAAFIRREQLTFREVDIFIPGLPKDLEWLATRPTERHPPESVCQRAAPRALGRYGERNQGAYRPRNWRPDQPRGRSARHLSASLGPPAVGRGNDRLPRQSRDLCRCRALYDRRGRKARDALSSRSQSQPLHFGDSILNIVGSITSGAEGYLVGADI